MDVIHDNWSTRESLAAIGCVKIAMPKDAYQDMYWCLHFTDDWEEEDGVEWKNKYLDDKWTSQPTAKHREKLEMLRTHLIVVGRKCSHRENG